MWKSRWVSANSQKIDPMKGVCKNQIQTCS